MEHLSLKQLNNSFLQVETSSAGLHLSVSKREIIFACKLTAKERREKYYPIKTVKVYCFTNNQNGKKYIGWSSDILKRFFVHLYNKKPSYFQKSLQKNGINNFTITILWEGDSISEAKKKEIEFIELYNTINEGYNLSKGGDGTVGHKHTEETKRKISEYLKNKWKEKEYREHHSKILEANRYKRHHGTS